MNYVQILNENFNKKYLNEAYWYEIKAGNNNYYAYVVDTSALNELIKNTSAWKKKTHNPINKKVLDKCINDINNNGGKYTYNIINKTPNKGARVITAGASSFRNTNENNLDVSIRNELNKIPHDKIYTHHIDKQEYNQEKENLAIIPYSSGNIADASLAHKIMHTFNRNDVRNGSAKSKDIPYVVISRGAPTIRTIKINII